MRRMRAFTLIELLVVIGILALLIGIMMPSLREVRRLSKRTVCQKNLDQIGVAMQAYLLTNNPRDTFPYSCRMPTWEMEDAKDQGRTPLPPLAEVLRKELAAGKMVRPTVQGEQVTLQTSEVFMCPADENTMSQDDIPTQRYFDNEGTSYEWESNLNGERLDFKLIRIHATLGNATPGQRVRKVQLAQLYKNQMWMLFDFEAFHGGPNMIGSHNVLYVDGHVQSDRWDRDKQVGQGM